MRAFLGIPSPFPSLAHGSFLSLAGRLSRGRREAGIRREWGRGNSKIQKGQTESRNKGLTAVLISTASTHLGNGEHLERGQVGLDLRHEFCVKSDPNKLFRSHVLALDDLPLRNFSVACSQMIMLVLYVSIEVLTSDGTIAVSAFLISTK